MHVRVAHIRPATPAAQTAGPAFCLLVLSILWIALMSQVGFTPCLTSERAPFGSLHRGL